MQRALRMWGTPITLIALIALLAYGAWWGWNALTRPITEPKPDPCVTTSASVLNATQVTIRIYNGGGRQGLAGSTAAQLRTKGFRVPTVGNTEEKVGATVIVGMAEGNPEVALVAGFFPGATIRADQRVDSTVDVLVGSEFGGFNTDAPVEVAVPGGVACLPSSAEPTSAPS